MEIETGKTRTERKEVGAREGGGCQREEEKDRERGAGKGNNLWE